MQRQQRRQGLAPECDRLFEPDVRSDILMVLEFENRAYPDDIEAMRGVEMPLLAFVRPHVDHPCHVTQEPIGFGREDDP